MAHFDELLAKHPEATERELELLHQIDHLTWERDNLRRALIAQVDRPPQPALAKLKEG